MIPSQHRVFVGSVGLGTQNMCILSTVLISGLCPLVVVLFCPLNELSSISLGLIMVGALSIGTLVNSAVMSYNLNSSSASILSPVILSAKSLEFFT